MLSCLPIVSAGAKDVGVETKFRMLLEDMEPVANVHRSDRYFFEQIGQYPAQDPEWILIRGGLYDLSANGDIQYQYAAFGNKFLRANTNSSPFSLGYGVFDVKTNVFYDLVDAWDMNLNHLREVWDELAPAVPYDAKDKSSENGMYVIGDADVDGEVTILDATRIQRCLAELDENPWESFTATMTVTVILPSWTRPRYSAISPSFRTSLTIGLHGMNIIPLTTTHNFVKAF